VPEHTATEQPAPLDVGTADGPEIDGATAGDAPQARENRAIRRTRSVLAQRDNEMLVEDLREVRGRVRAAVARARRSRLASLELRARRAAADAGRQAALRSEHPDASADPAATAAHLAAVLDRAARRMLLADRDQRDPGGLDRSLGLIVAAALETVPHVERAGITLLDRDRTISSRVPSDAVVAELDAVQNCLGEGPGRTAIAARDHVLIRDLAAERSRWPSFVPVALERGVGTVLSFRLFSADDGTAGALNLYARRPGVFDEVSVETGLLFASQAALALHGARQASNLSEALSTRDEIGQAKGILMERRRLTAAEAFRLLVESSQATNMKLRDVAQWVVRDATARDTGGL
jgi:hypothetical protein